MSYDVYLEDRTAEPWCSYGKAEGMFDGSEPCSNPCYPAVEVARHAEGGTYQLGGTNAAELNVTYNYGRFYYPQLPEGLRTLHEKRAADCIEMLEERVQALGTNRDGDYWAATPGNAGYALSILLAWAKEHPDAVFRVS